MNNPELLELEPPEPKLIYLAMARGILMGKADYELNIDAILPEVTDWVSAVDDPKKVLKLARVLEKAQTNHERSNQNP